MTRSHSGLNLPARPGALVAGLLERDRRVLLLGPSGSGKTTLARGLAAELAADGRPAQCLVADPGLPGAGVPGALCLCQWTVERWSVLAMEALCSLDAARFRLPLVAAVRTLAADATAGTLLVDTPGVVRGVAGAELLEALVSAAAIELVLVIERSGQARPLAGELEALGVEVAWVEASERARRPGPAARARERTRLWDRYLVGGATHEVALDALRLVGTPPRRANEAWAGKQVAFLAAGRTAVMGEALGLEGDRLRVRLPSDRAPTDTLLVRDAGRDGEGLLVTARPFAADLVHYVPPPDVLAGATAEADGGMRPVVHLDTGVACLINGVFGDPLLHLRLGHQRRSLLFDLGEGSRLPARVAHQVSDVFVSHAHADHICGFLWLLRSRIGEPGVCRLFGPPGLAGNLEGLIRGILWDRIGEHGPLFEVAELHGPRLRRFRLRAGAGRAVALPDQSAPEGVILDEGAFRVRCVALDHGTTVLAFAYEAATRIKVRKERLDDLGLRPGPWLTGLKQRMLKGDFGGLVELPDASRRSVAQLAAELTQSGPGDKLVYATDLADTPENRRRLIGLAADADCLFCEACFLERDRVQAGRTGHLTARACGEIASAAGVGLLIPFHFSRRYEGEVWRVYEEVAPVCPQVVIPKGRPEGSS